MKIDHPIRFSFASEKALSAIHWMVCETDGTDLHTMLKSCYFADKDHLNQYGRPIFGATYRAMRFGPVPLEIYEMAKGESLWLAELNLERFPWDLVGYRLKLTANDAPDMSKLSASDMDALRSGFSVSSKMSFTARTAATHGSDWQKANLGTMRYEDMLRERADKEEMVESLKQLGPIMRM